MILLQSVVSLDGWTKQVNKKGKKKKSDIVKAEENVASFLKQSEEVAVISTTPQDAYEDVEGTKQVCYSRKQFCQANVIVIIMLLYC